MTTLVDMKVRLAIVRERINSLRPAVTEYFDLVSEERGLEHALQFLYHEKDGVKIERLPPGEKSQKRTHEVANKNIDVFKKLTPAQQQEILAKASKL